MSLGTGLEALPMVSSTRNILRMDNRDPADGRWPLRCTLAVAALWWAWNVSWIFRNQDYNGFDVINHLVLCQDVHARLLAAYRLHGLLGAAGTIVAVLREGLNWPQLPHLVSAIFQTVVGNAEKGPFLANSVYAAAAIAGVYLLAGEISGGWGGFLAALSLMLMPGVVGYNRLFSLDWPMTAFAVLAIALTVRSGGLLDRGASALVAAACAAAMLCKMQVLILLAVPIGLLLVRADRADRAAPDAAARRRTRKIHLGIVAGVVAAVLVFWLTETGDKAEDALYQLFLHLGRDWGPEALRSMKFGFDLHYPVGSLPWLLYYPKVFLIHTGVPLTLLFIVSTLMLVRHRARLDDRGWTALLAVIVTIAWSYVLFTLMSSKTPRYFAPAYPCAAVLIGAAMARAGRPVRIGIGVPLLTASLALCVIWSDAGKEGRAITGLNYRVMGAAVSEVWIRPPEQRHLIGHATFVAESIRHFSYYKTLPSTIILPLPPPPGDEDEGGFFQLQMGFSYGVITSFAPWLSMALPSKTLLRAGLPIHHIYIPGRRDDERLGRTYDVIAALFYRGCHGAPNTDQCAPAKTSELEDLREIGDRLRALAGKPDTIDRAYGEGFRRVYQSGPLLIDHERSRMNYSVELVLFVSPPLAEALKGSPYLLQHGR